MKFFTNKKFLFKFIAVLCICLTIINFGLTPVAQADDSIVSKIGGVLIDPICSLILVLGDGIMEIIQQSIMGSNATAIFDNTNGVWWETVAKFVGAALVVALAVFVVVITGLTTLPAILLAAAKIATIGVVANILTNGGVLTAVSAVSAAMMGDNIVLPTFTIGPEEIFSGRILLFDPNIFDPEEIFVTTSLGNEMKAEEWNETDDSGNFVNRGNDETADGYFYYDDNGNKIATSTNNAAYDLKNVVAKWYYIIRNIAIIGLMLVLVYVGIRMLLTSIASDKAKYKQMLSDWVIALCLVFLMQYIMVFANSFVDGITNIFSTFANGNLHTAIIQEPKDNLEESIEEISTDYVQEDGNGKKVIAWPTNLMGRIRVQAQQHDGTAEYVGYSLCYFVLVLYTLFFAFTYAKRLLYLLFLTVIAPFVALTYPLDKIRDGQAQAFNMWVKEYFINLIIQPFHLLLYVIFISMAFELAGTNIIYSLVVLGFMIPAEKFLRNMFGFNRASSPGFLAGAAGAAMTISAVQSLAKFAGRGHGGGKSSGGKGDSGSNGGNDNLNIRSADSGNTAQSLMEASVAEDSSGSSEGEGTNPPTTPRGRGPNPPIISPEGGNSSAQQRMLEQYDEGFGTDEYDPAEREAMARDLNANNTGNMYENMSDDEKLRQFMDDTGYTEEEAAELLGIDLGETNRDGEDSNSSDNPPQRRIFEPTDTQPISPAESEQTTGKLKQKKGYIRARAENFAARNFNKKRAGELIKGGLKTATTIGMGATAAGIGVAAGIASGSPGDAFKYGVSGAYAGSSIGQGISNRTGRAVEKQNQLHEETRRTQYGDDEYERRKNDELDKEFKRDKEMRKLYSMQFNNAKGKELDQIMEQATEYRKYGITDNTKIIRAMSLASNPEERAKPQYIAAAKLSQAAKSEKDLESVMKRFGKTKGVTDKQKQDMENRIRMINKETLN